MVLRFKRTVATVVAVVVAIGIFALSEGMRQGVQTGLRLTADTVIPSLFLFTAVVLYLSYSGASAFIGRLISPVTRILFGLNGAVATTFLLSLVAGYPVGAKMIDALYKNGGIDRLKSLKMLTFSINAGPAFIVVAVGQNLLGSRSDGWRLFLAHILASCLVAAVVRFIPDRLFAKKQCQNPSLPAKSQHDRPLSDAFVLSVKDAASTMLSVAAFVVLFSGVGGMISALPFGNTVRRFLEVTAGVVGCTRSQLPTVAFLLGFGGVSVIFQVMASAGNLRPPFALIIVSRLTHGTVSWLLILFFEVVSPRSFSTGAFNIAGNAAVHTSPFAAAALVFMCVVLLCFTHGVRGSCADC